MKNDEVLDKMEIPQTRIIHIIKRQVGIIRSRTEKSELGKCDTQMTLKCRATAKNSAFTNLRSLCKLRSEQVLRLVTKRQNLLRVRKGREL